MNNKSLNSILNEMARAENIVRTAGSKNEKTKPLSEIEAFAVLDNTLNSLNKQYLDSKVQRQELVVLNGPDDPMAVIAMDMEDSAWCAMQTRYIELRADRKMMHRAQVMMRQKERQIEEMKERALISEKQKKERDFINYLKVLDVIKGKNKTPQIFEWFALFLFFRVDILGQALDKKAYYFNKQSTMAA